MKSVSFFLLSILLVVAILAPSVITLVDLDTKTELVMDFNEEDNKKEEKKEDKEKELFSSLEFYATASSNDNTSKVSSFYLEKEYSFSASISLPPPKHRS